MLPACLPWLGFAPWTGWIVFDEFDILVLAMLAGSYVHVALHGNQEPDQRLLRGSAGWLAAGFGAFGAIGLIIGLSNGMHRADAWAPDWFHGEADALNSLRVAKSLLFAGAFVPLLQRQLLLAPAETARRFAGGIVAGLAVVCIAVAWERAAIPGLLNFHSSYRTTALFWEMHVGGAAIDAYLAMAGPFVVWALASARTPARWMLAGALALLAGYAGLTTFSRGVYLAGVGSLSLLIWLYWRRHATRRSRWLQLGGAALAAGLLDLVAFDSFGYAGAAVALALVAAAILAWHRHTAHADWRFSAGLMLSLMLLLETVAVLGAGSFMKQRLAEADEDLGSRLVHWADGIELLEGPRQWLLGLGFGRLPASYADTIAGREFSGSVRLVPDRAGTQAVLLTGPKTLSTLAGKYGLTQRVPLLAGTSYRIDLRAESSADANLRISVCRTHLLYDGRCQVARVRLQPGAPASLSLPLAGPWLASPGSRLPAMASLRIAVDSPGAAVRIEHVGLRGGDTQDLLRNGDFTDGLTGWFPVAQRYFVPWHIDNLALDLLIDGGLAGLLLFAVLMATALRRLLGRAVAPYWAASLLGALLVGLVSSVLDVPRVALLLWLLASFGVLQPRGTPSLS